MNALAPNQKLRFAKKGLTVIYGDNGSGKSGYVRVLKHACRTRDRGAKILRDVEDVDETPQTAKIVFARGATDLELEWKPEGTGHSDLPSISILDSRSANIHVEKTNAVAYIPTPMKILETLASTCDRIKNKLKAQLAALDAQTPLALQSPSLSSKTAAGAFVHGLSAKSNLEQLGLLATLSTDEKKRLSTLEADLAQEPNRAAERIRNQKRRLDEHIAALKRVDEFIKDSAFVARDDLKAERDAATLASESLFAAAPLPAIGQATWRGLWDAARKYSGEIAYPEKHFPDADAGDLCVLCQQPLSEEAMGRRTTFESFVKGSTKADEEAAQNAYVALLSRAKAKTVTIDSIRQLHALCATEIGDSDLAKNLKEYCVRAAWRLRAYCCESSAPGVMVEFPEAAVSELSNSMATRAAQSSASQGGPEHQALVAECLELANREALAPLLEDIKVEIARRKQAAAINKAMKDTAKIAVTNKNKVLSDQLVTNALRGRFAREIEKINLTRMPVELRKIKNQNAVSFFQVCLVEKPDAAVGEIFSEGEHRCVALAAFLAELVTSKQYSGIVFDDPMSSLDHVHRKAVVGRLIEEAAHRQVIVFTHDLTFLYELRREVEAKDCPILYQTIRRKQDRPGHVEGELPVKAKSARQLTAALRSELKAAKGQFEQWPEIKRTLFCKGVIEQLREAWDQGIADFVFPVLGRFDNHIKGSSLFKLAILDEDDVMQVTAARGRLSEELHASAETLNPETVSREDLQTEIGKLEVWLDNIVQRQKDAKKPVTSYV